MEKIYYLAPGDVYNNLEQLSEQYHKPIPDMTAETIFTLYSESGSLTALSNTDMDESALQADPGCIKSFPDEYAKGFYFELPDYIFSAIQKKATRDSISPDKVYSFAIREYYRKNSS